ncbi:MAG: 3-oxoacyl-ACP synthase [Methanosarcinales archaeon]|nr:3-oxoacyl-ACP synthase [Methanosarcinales archaeon]
MKNYYINGIGCVSAQDTSKNDFSFEDCNTLQNNVVSVFKPAYKSYIKPALIRRMSNGVKMGVVASSIALKEANVTEPRAIITGSGMGCLKDSEKFLENIINNKEQYLTPTSFIQSTHNTVGAQIALGLSCKSYNVTYVHSATSFESSLIDAMMTIDDGTTPVLVGGVDEIGAHTIEHYKLVGYVKNEKDVKKNILKSKSKGAIFSEGAQFFVIENKRSDNSYAKLIDVSIYENLKVNEVEIKALQFLNNNNIQISDLDIIILGNNGDIDFDSFYESLQNKAFINTQQLYYKHFAGEYNTVSAFGLWTACKLLKSQNVSKILKINNKETTAINYILLYNQYQGRSHSFTLLKKC